MKLFLAFALLIPGLAFAATGISIGGKDVIRIDVEEDAITDSIHARTTSELHAENSRLRKRVQRLEMAVRQLQDRTFNLEVSNNRPTVTLAPKEHTCYLKTTFEGTMMGKGGSEAEARAKALQECDNKNGGLSCKEENLRCSASG